MKEIADLEYIIPILDTLYDQGEPCVHPFTGIVVPDSDYDAMRARLAVLSPNSTVLQGTNASQVIVSRIVKHNPPMTSISKAIGTLEERKNELAKWQNDVVKELHYKESSEKWACQAYKLDGVACALYYKQGKLTYAGSRRRDGVSGEDITENVKFVEGVFPTLPFPLTGTIRGEVICRKSAFRKINAERKKNNEEPYANERNYAAGSLRQAKDPSVTKDRNLTFIAYTIISDDLPSTDEVEIAKWCNKVLMVPYVQTRPFNQKSLETMEGNAELLDYQVDGVVLSVRNTDDREQMGHHGGDPIKPPKGRLAWKFEDEHVDVSVRDIVWETGRTGAIIPVLEVPPVQLEGTTVCRCTGHNLGFLQRKKIGIGTIIRIIKSGKIIPKVTSVISGHTTVSYPKKCPTCGSDTVVTPGTNPEMTELMCLNLSCKARIVSTIVHYLQTLGVKGVAESTIQKLYDAGLVSTLEDLYKINHKQLEDIGLGSRNSRLVIARIHMVDQAERIDDIDVIIDKVTKKKKLVPLWQFFASLGIEGAGKTCGKALMEHFGEFKLIISATEEQLSQIDGIGEKTATVISEFFSHNKKLVASLLDHIEFEAPKTGKLSGKVFCLTGGFPEGKTAVEGMIMAAGGKTSSSVSKKVDYVVVGTDAGSKEQKADELGIKKIGLSELRRLL